MSSPQVRRFNFFDQEVVKDDQGQPWTGLESMNVQVATSGHQQLILGDNDGFILLIDRSLTMTSYKAFGVSVNLLHQMKQHNILIAVGSDDEGKADTVKVFNMDRGDAPQCVRTFKAIHGSKSRAITVVAAHEDMSHIAVGLEDGSVLLFKGDVSRDRLSNKAGRLIFESATPGPITGLAFRQEGPDVVLFVATTSNVCSFFLTQKDRREDLDAVGCELGCSVQSESDGSFIIARPECVYSYEPEGRGAALGFEGDKKILAWFRNYLVLVLRDNKVNRDTNTVSKINTVTIYDVRNKFIACSVSLNEVLFVLNEWNALYVLCGDGKLYKLAEKDFQTKLDMLYNKHMFDVAINLAKQQQQLGSTEASDNLVEIYSRYAERLYEKGSYNEAIQQYIKTIGRLEPSHVIRKFLDSQRIFNLTDYLQALHERELADKHHTTLLLNCYTKLKRVDKLDEFIMTKKNLNFDLETAIQVCRQAGYYKHATYLARNHQQHDWYLKIQLEDLKGFQDALDYISGLDFEAAEKSLKLYGKDLVNELPEKTTDLLVRLCTGAHDGGNRRAHPEEFIHLYVNQLPSLITFLESIVKFIPDSPSQVYDTLLELYLRAENIDRGDTRATLARERSIMDLLQSPTAKYDEYHAMVLTQIYDFRPGILYLYERARQYQQIIQYYMEKNAYQDIIEACKKYGSNDRNLWVETLSYFASKEEDCKAQISEVLQHIDKKNLLPPLMVIEALSHNSTATLAVIRDYITRRLEQENENIAQDERRIREYREETDKMRGEIKDLRTQAKIFQEMKCANCKNGLDLPAVHFLCGHSYHQRCLVGMTEECTHCSEDRRKVREIVQSQQMTADQHDAFFKQLESADNRFGVVAEYFGRGVFNKSSSVAPSAKKQTAKPKPKPPVDEEVPMMDLGALGISSRITLQEPRGGYNNNSSNW